MGQGSALSLILSALYIAPLLHLFERRAQALNLDTSTLSYVNDGLLVSQGRMYNKILPELTSSYSIVSDLMASFGLVSMTSQRSFTFLERITTPTLSWISQLLALLFSNPRPTGNTWAFILIDGSPSRNMFGSILPRH